MRLDRVGAAPFEPLGTYLSTVPDGEAIEKTKEKHRKRSITPAWTINLNIYILLGWPNYDCHYGNRCHNAIAALATMLTLLALQVCGDKALDLDACTSNVSIGFTEYPYE